MTHRRLKLMIEIYLRGQKSFLKVQCWQVGRLACFGQLRFLLRRRRLLAFFHYFVLPLSWEINCVHFLEGVAQNMQGELLDQITLC